MLNIIYATGAIVIVSHGSDVYKISRYKLNQIITYWMLDFDSFEITINNIKKYGVLLSY